MSNSLVQNTYQSDDDDGDDIFDGYDFQTIPTQPLPHVVPTATRHITQPTQPLKVPLQRQKLVSPPPSRVQVDASSPFQPSPRAPSHDSKPAPSSGPKLPQLQKGALNGGILARSLAPPGTQFRSPFQPRSQDARSQTLELEFSDDEDRVVDSSDEEEQRPAWIKPSVFMRDGKPINAAGHATRVEESPRPTGFSRFAYGGPPVPQKRSVDVMANAYGSSRKPKVPRQTEPARALPVELPDISYDDILDWNLQEKVKRMRYALGDTASIRKCRDALILKHLNYSDAMEHITDEIDRDERREKASQARARSSATAVDLTNESDGDELTSKSPMQNMPKLGVKRDVKNVKTITEKWATQNRKPTTSTQDQVERPITPPPKKPKKRLIRPEQVLSSPVQVSPPPVPSQRLEKPQPAQKPITIDSDLDEGVAIPPDEDTDSESVESQDHSASEAKLLKFLNGCTLDQIVEISNQPLDNIKKVLEHRPFHTLNAVRDICIEATSNNKARKNRTSKKQIGNRLVDVCLEMLEGYEAVDDLVAECEELGKPLRKEMERLGFLNTAQVGELQVVDLASPGRDSGIGTPAPSSPSASIDEDFDAEARIRSKKKASTKKGPSLSQPALMSSDCTLKDYQVTGLNWLAQLFSNNMSGILADDMGLGKTIQVIAFLAHLFEIGTKGPHLVIVPGSTLENWLREFRNFCPKMRVEPYYGSHNERPELQLRLEDELDEINVIVTTYDMAVSSGSDSKFLRRTKPVVCVYDEGHTLKNSQTKRYKELMRIPAQFRLLLTGTPLQNNLQELMALLGFIMPEVFQRHQDQLEVIFKHKAKTSSNDADDNTGRAALLSAQRVSRARSMITPFILRRKKEQVLKHLPKKTCRVELCELSETQREIYHAEVEKGKQALMDRANGIAATAKLKANVLMELRKSAIHPLLFRHRFSDGILRKMSTACLGEPEFALSNPELVWEDFSVMTDFEINRFCHRYERTMSRFALPDLPAPCMDSGKVVKLVEILTRHVRNKDRTLVFSQFTMVMDILEQVFESEGISFSRLDGATKMQERQDLIDQFTNDTSISVFMLSTKAGGAGINLACANKVVIFDSSFNPQDDIQAENRAHRVGQEREVEVVRLVTKGTIEEQIHELGRTKLALDERVAGDGGQTEKEAAAAEAEGMDLVARMMKDGMDGGTSNGEDKAVKKKEKLVTEIPDRSDLKEEYMKGLQEAGLMLAST